MPTARICAHACRVTPSLPAPFPTRVKSDPISVFPLAVFPSRYSTAQALSRRLGFTYNISVANSSVSPDEVIASVADGTFDIAASWITINAARMEYVSFSYPFYDSGLNFVYR
ncbi:unnamed protein product, partial [Laminaria digitata]